MICSELLEKGGKKEKKKTYARALHHKKIYIMNMSSVAAPELRKWAGPQFSMQPVWEDGVSLQGRGREWMSVAWRERYLTSQLPLSVILSFQWCMDVIWHCSPRGASQCAAKLRNSRERQREPNPCYEMTKLHDGGEGGHGACKRYPPRPIFQYHIVWNYPSRLFPLNIGSSTFKSRLNETKNAWNVHFYIQLCLHPRLPLYFHGTSLNLSWGMASHAFLYWC